MKKSILNYLYLCLFIFVIGSMIASCKKDHSDDGGTPNPPPGPTQLSDADSLTYLMYRIMEVSFVDGGRDSTYDLPTYYWYNSVPALNPLSGDYDSADVLLKKIKTYPINPSTNKPYDKYSFLDKTGAVAGEIQQGVAGDIGMQVTYAGDGTPANTSLYVLFADKNSPAGQQGVQRGWQITAINGGSVSYDGSNGPNVRNVINAVYNDPSASFTFKKTDGTSFTTTLAKTVYDINPILFDSVYTVGANKVGYFVFNTFSNVTNNNAPTLTKTEIDRVFNKFASAGINSLIVDLRYNGGGSVATTEYLDNKIAPASVQGKEMYHYIYNDKLTAMEDEIGLEKKVNFTDGGALNLAHVFFIGTDNTASAAELTINNLKPYMDVKLVGSATYGKPVGFFTFSISDYPNGVKKNLADLYAINFETKNANNEGGYFDGLTPDAEATDYVDVPWGNTTYDDNLKKIFSFLSTGSFPRISTQARMANGQSLKAALPVKMPSLRFNGMVDYRVSKQLQPFIEKSLRRSH